MDLFPDTLNVLWLTAISPHAEELKRNISDTDVT